LRIIFKIDYLGQIVINVVNRGGMLPDNFLNADREKESGRSFGCFKRKRGKWRAEDVRVARPTRRLCDADQLVVPSDDSSGAASVPSAVRNEDNLCGDRRLG